MKKLFFFLMLSSCVTFFSCGSDDEEETVADFVTATIAGDSFEATSILGVSDDSGSEELVLMSGRITGGYGIGLNILSSIQTGVVNEIDENDLAITFTDAAENAFYTDGQFVLTARDTENRVLEGTFSFTATEDGNPSNVIEVTGGAFKITYF